VSNITIEGLQQAQAANARLITAIKPTNGLGRAVLFLTTAVNRDLLAFTHVVTGALRAAHRMQIVSPLHSKLYIDPAARNPVSGSYPAIYGVIENARGGSHAFAEIAVNRANLHMSEAVELIKSEF
jgi:hypothetical protein